MTDPRFMPRPQRPTAKPRRVYNGVKLRSKDGPDLSAWPAQRWMRLAESLASPSQLTEGIEYARLGQTRRLDVSKGQLTARVQGRMPDAYSVAVRLPTFASEQWEQIIASMAGQARFAAALLSGELPAGIEDLFGPLGLRLFPTGQADIVCSCTCDIARGVAPVDPTVAPATAATQPPAAPATPAEAPSSTAVWCKHVCCILTLIADRLSADPFLVFLLRGLGSEELLDKLRQNRAATQARSISAGATDVPIYVPHLPGVSDAPHPPLEQTLDRFWSLGPSIEQLELPIGPPEVTHPLLRRLGPSPFDPPAAKFPLVGLLATCYDVISAAAIRAEEGDPLPPIA